MRKPTRLAIESLEQRQAMAADITAVLAANGVLSITSDNGDGTITIDRTATQIRLKETNQSFLISKVKSIAIDLGSDNDTLKFSGLGPRAQWTGTPITIESQGGSDRLILNGKPVYFGGVAEEKLSVDRIGNVKIDGKKPDWFDYNVAMDSLGIQARALSVDKVFDRHDMLQLFDAAEENDVLGEDDFNSLRAIGNNKSLFKGLDWVQCLTGYVVNPSVANVKFEDQALGNLTAQSTNEQLTLLVDKWFHGKDHPKTPGVGAVTYEAISGELFHGDPNYEQVQQGDEGDCFFLGTLNAIAAQNPQVIKDMFVFRDDVHGVWTLRFFDHGKARYITVDNMLPVYDGGSDDGEFVYDAPLENSDNHELVLWAALAEKAYAQLAEFGWSHPDIKANSYNAINGGLPEDVLRQVTGKSASAIAITDHSRPNQAVAAWQAGRPATFGSETGNSTIVSDHNYGLIGYNPNNKEFLLSNPWGAGGNMPATISLTWDEIKTHFTYWYLGSKS